MSSITINNLMRIDEVITEASIFDERTLQQTVWKSPHQLERWLLRNKFSKLGAGSYGAAYWRTGYNRIVKISYREDECWTRFAKWCLQQRSNPNLPNIQWIKVYGDGKFFVAMIEKLTSLKPNHLRMVPVADLALLYAEEAWLEDDLAKVAEQMLLEEEMLDEDNIHSPEAIKITQQYVIENPSSFTKTYFATKKLVSGACEVDLHDGNLMFRESTNSIVIIDPLADFSAIT